jgi:Fe-S cluster biogenesis protein NfuA
MTNRTNEQITEDIKQVLEQYIAPAVAGHGGEVNFVSFEAGLVMLELSGACSGCAGSAATLKFGVENMLREMVPEVTEVQGMDDPSSTVDPYYSMMDMNNHMSSWGPADDFDN